MRGFYLAQSFFIWRKVPRLRGEAERLTVTAPVTDSPASRLCSICSILSLSFSSVLPSVLSLACLSFSLLPFPLFPLFSLLFPRKCPETPPGGCRGVSKHAKTVRQTPRAAYFRAFLSLSLVRTLTAGKHSGKRTHKKPGLFGPGLCCVPCVPLCSPSPLRYGFTN